MATKREADAKERRIALIVFSVLFLIGYLLWIIPSNLYSHYYFQNAATGWKVVGFLSIGVHAFFLWRKFATMLTGVGDKGSPAWALFFWYAINLCLLSGFNFSLPQ